MAGGTIKINLRFRFNAQNRSTALVKSKLQDTAQLIVEDVAYALADAEYQDFVALDVEIAGVLHREVANLARLMTRGIVGRAASDAGYRGALDVAEKGGPGGSTGTAAAGGLPRFNFSLPWAARSEKYLRRKERKVRHRRWFDYGGDLKKFLNDGDQLLASLGPIEVEFERVGKRVDQLGYTRDERGRFAPASAGNARLTSLSGTRGRPFTSTTIVIGRIKVNVFGRLTPEMLPALVSRNPNDLKPGYQTGLNWLFPEDISNRLNPSPTKNKPYRFTTEPYLSWFMTKAVPYAVARRIGQLRR